MVIEGEKKLTFKKKKIIIPVNLLIINTVLSGKELECDVCEYFVAFPLRNEFKVGVECALRRWGSMWSNERSLGSKLP